MPDLLPVDEADTKLIELSTIRAELTAARAELAQLRTIAENAHYAQGPYWGCVDPDDLDCEEYWDGTERREDVEWCSHVVHHHATYADLAARQLLEHAIGDVLTELAAAEPDLDDIREAIENGVMAAGGELDDHSPTTPRGDLYARVRDAYMAKVTAGADRG